MTRPPRLCTCGKIVPYGQRCTCQINATRERNRRHDAQRPNATQRGYNHEWRKARKDFLQVRPDCVMCGNPASVVDHIQPHKGNQRLFWMRSNWQSLCPRCHNSTKQRQELLYASK